MRQYIDIINEANAELDERVVFDGKDLKMDTKFEGLMVSLGIHDSMQNSVATRLEKDGVFVSRSPLNPNSPLRKLTPDAWAQINQSAHPYFRAGIEDDKLFIQDLT